MPDLPPSPPEQEHYSLDEMMQRLKERGHEEGELVTRADGTVAIKVKKRKRRSKQPHKEKEKRQQRFRMIQIGVVFFLLTTALASAVGMLFYYNSTTFRESTLEKISEWTGAKVDLAEFSVTPNSAKAANAQFTWPEGNYLRRLELSHPSAPLDLYSFIGRRWGGSAVLAKSGKLIFGSALHDAPQSYGTPDPSTPFPFAFSSYRCENLNISGLRDNQAPWLTIEDTEASLVKTSRGSQTRFVGGAIKIMGFPAMKIDRGSIDFEQDQMLIENLRLKPATGNGTLELSNPVELYHPTRAELQLTMSEFPLDVLMGQELDVIFSGFVNTPSSASHRVCRLTPGDLNSFQIHTDFRGCERDALTIRNFPFLRDLSNELQNPEYAREFAFTDRVEGELIRTYKETTIKGLRLEKKDYFAIRGDMQVIDRILTGTFQVGLPTELLWNSQQHAALKRIFSRQQDGFLWCEVRLSGEPGKPQDDFSSQLERALEQESQNASKPSKRPQLDIEKELEE